MTESKDKAGKRTGTREDAKAIEPEKKRPPEAEKEKGRAPKGILLKIRFFLLLSLRIGFFLLILALGIAVSIYAWHARDLPGFETLADYNPPQSSRLVSGDGEIVGELFVERRTVVEYGTIPSKVKNAFIAAEDERFFEHEGLDYFGIARAMIRNLQAGEVREGASTITQQVVKTFLLSPERRFSRKFREMILARRLERNLSKDEILYLYLNQIYFGHGRYGIEEASLFYFGKGVKEIELHQAAILAALPRAPNLYSPRRYPDRALGRRAYVIRRMLEAGMIDAKTAETALSLPLDLSPLPAKSVGDYYIEEVRRMLNAELGSKLLLGGGLIIEVGMNPAMQAAAESALEENLLAIDKRQGWRGAISRLDPGTAMTIVNRFNELVSVRKRRGLEGPFAFDLAAFEDWDREEPAPGLRLVDPENGIIAAGIVIRTEDGKAEILLGEILAILSFSDMRWARQFNPDNHTPAPRNITDILNPGDIVNVRLIEPDEEFTDLLESEKGNKESGEKKIPTDNDPAGMNSWNRLVEELKIRKIYRAVLEQHPLVEGAVVAIDPASRNIVAMTGGYAYSRSSFNRATQARRQPGSAFKHTVYGAAIESKKYHAASMVLDAPEMFRDPWTGKTWTPRNYDGLFDGDINLRESLARSKNAVAVRLAADVGIDAVIDFAQRSGINSSLPRFLPLALGSGEVSPLELVNSYTTLAAGGISDKAVLVRSVRDSTGIEIYRHESEPRQKISSETAYILTDLLKSVLTEGTGRSLNRLDRPTAGKTGTTDDRRDAWFVGYTADLVAGVWTGFDDPRPLGRAEYGGRAAGPAWLSFMQEALHKTPPRPFNPPPGIQFVRIDPKSGLLAPPGYPGIYEPFLPDSAPLREASADSMSPLEFIMEKP